jgi:hypothetical protein
MKNSNLNTRNNKDGFAVPEGYFDKMKSKVLQKTYPKKKQIVILNSSLMKYAAILLIGFLVGGGWYFMQTQTSQNDELFGVAIENQLYAYDYAMLDEYTSMGSESELTDSEDELFLNSEYGDEILMYEGE